MAGVQSLVDPLLSCIFQRVVIDVQDSAEKKLSYAICQHVAPVYIIVSLHDKSLILGFKRRNVRPVTSRLLADPDFSEPLPQLWIRLPQYLLTTPSLAIRQC